MFLKNHGKQRFPKILGNVCLFFSEKHEKKKEGEKEET